MRKISWKMRGITGVLAFSLVIGQAHPVFALRETQIGENPAISTALSVGLEERSASPRRLSTPRKVGLVTAGLALVFGGVLLWMGQGDQGPVPDADVPGRAVPFKPAGPLQSGNIGGDRPPPVVDPPSAFVPAGVIDDADLPEMQRRMLEEQKGRPLLQMQLNRQWVRWIEGQFSRGYASRLDFDYAHLALERAPVIEQERNIVAIQQKFLAAPFKDRAGLYRELQTAIDRQLQAEIDYWQEKLTKDTYYDRADIKFREEVVGNVKDREWSLSLLRKKIEIHIKQLEELKLLYGNLAKLKSYLPLPGMMPPGVSFLDVRELVPVIVPEVPIPNINERGKTIAHVRGNIARLLELEDQITTADDTIADIYYGWAARMDKKGFLTGRVLDTAEYEKMLNTVRKAGRNVLKAQQNLVKATTPQEQLKAQKALDAANKAQQRAMLKRAESRVSQVKDQIGRMRYGVLPSWKKSDDELMITLAEIEVEGLQSVGEIYDALTGLGLPTFPVSVNAPPRTSLLNFQALVPPMVIGAPIPENADEARRFYEQLAKLPDKLREQRVAVLRADQKKLLAEADRNLTLYYGTSPGTAQKGSTLGIQRDNWQDIKNGVAVAEAQAKVREALIALVEAEGKSPGDFIKARGEYEKALFAQMDAEISRVRDRLERKKGRLTIWLRYPKAYGPLRLSELEAEIEADNSIERQIKDQREFYVGLRKKGIPLPALGGVISTAPSAESLQLLIGDNRPAFRGLGIVQHRVDGKNVPSYVIPGEGMWMWLSRPRYVPGGGERKVSPESTLIPKGFPGEGNRIPKERILNVAAFTEDGPKEYSIAVLGDWQYEEQSGYYWVVGGKDIYTVDTKNAIRLGVLVKRDSKNETKEVTPTHGLIGCATYEVKSLKKEGKVGMMLVPVGITTQEVPLEVYNAKEDGKEAPIPLKALGVDELGRPKFGRLYLGGQVTYGPRGEEYFGDKKGEKGEKLPLVYERVGARLLLTEMEVRVVFDEDMGRPIVSVTHHPVEVPKKGGLEESVDLLGDLEDQAIAVLQHKIGRCPSADLTSSKVYLLDETNYDGQDESFVSWGPILAKTGVPVAVLTRKSAVAEGLKKLFHQAGIPEDQYQVASIQDPEFDGDKGTALAALQRAFQGGAEFTPVSPSVRFEIMKKILEEMGFIFVTADFKVDFRKIEVYLEILA